MLQNYWKIINIYLSKQVWNVPNCLLLSGILIKNLQQESLTQKAVPERVLLWTLIAHLFQASVRADLPFIFFMSSLELFVNLYSCWRRRRRTVASQLPREPEISGLTYLKWEEQSISRRRCLVWTDWLKSTLETRKTAEDGKKTENLSISSVFIFSN